MIPLQLLATFDESAIALAAEFDASVLQMDAEFDASPIVLSGEMDGHTLLATDLDQVLITDTPERISVT